MTQPAGAPPYFAALRGHQYLRLTSFRRSGAAVPTPVWFAPDGESLVVFSLADAGKVKRIRANPSVLVAPCSMRGEARGPNLAAVARILPEAEVPGALAALSRKYGLTMRLGTALSRLAGRRRAYLRLSPP